MIEVPVLKYLKFGWRNTTHQLYKQSYSTEQTRVQINYSNSEYVWPELEWLNS